MTQIQAHIREVQTISHTNRALAVIDDCQRLGAIDQPLNVRLAIVVEQPQETAVNLNIPILAVWPDLREERGALPQIWCERAASADVILVLETEAEPKKVSEPNRVTLHVVKNRGGEKGKVVFDFLPPFAKFVETSEI